MQWELQVEGTQLTDAASGKAMPPESFLVRGYDAIRTGGPALPGNLVTVPRVIKDEPTTMYSSNGDGDSGFNSNYGTYVPLGFGVKVPAAQPQGNYTARITLIMTE